MAPCRNCGRTIPKVKFVNRKGDIVPVENNDKFCPSCGDRDWFE